MTTTYLDSCMVIGLIEGDAEQRDVLKAYLTAAQQVFSSELVRLEARVLALRQDQLEHLKRYDAFFDACVFVNLDRTVFNLATKLRAESQLKTPDALHLAAALTAGSDAFCTNDKQLVKIAGQRIKVIDWEMLL